MTAERDIAGLLEDFSAERTWNPDTIEQKFAAWKGLRLALAEAILPGNNETRIDHHVRLARLARALRGEGMNKCPDCGSNMRPPNSKRLCWWCLGCGREVYYADRAALLAALEERDG